MESMNKKLISFIAAGLVVAGSAAQGAISLVIDFDTADNWTAGSGQINSYQTDHQYSESSMTFTGGPALRNTTTATDGFAGALGTYSWRLRDATDSAPVAWTATYTAALEATESFSGFGFDARRWDGSPSPNYTVEYSLNGGTDWTTATSIGTNGKLDNTAFGNSSDWSSFSQSLASSNGLAANQFVVRFSALGGERIMIDNFTVTAVPEPSTYAAIAFLMGIGLVVVRRRARKP
jgi:hypothetical protein